MTLFSVTRVWGEFAALAALLPLPPYLPHDRLRNIREQAELLKKRRWWQKVRVLGVDGAYPLLKGKKPATLIAVDLGTGQPVVIGKVNEANPQAAQRFLKPLVKHLGVSVIVTEPRLPYRTVAEKLDLEHRVCQFHARRWVGLTLHDLRQSIPEEWRWVLDEAKQLLAELPPEGSRRLFELWKQTGQSGEHSPLAKLRNILLRVFEH